MPRVSVIIPTYNCDRFATNYWHHKDFNIEFNVSEKN